MVGLVSDVLDHLVMVIVDVVKSTDHVVVVMTMIVTTRVTRTVTRTEKDIVTKNETKTVTIMTKKTPKTRIKTVIDGKDFETMSEDQLTKLLKY